MTTQFRHFQVRRPALQPCAKRLRLMQTKIQPPGTALDRRTVRSLPYQSTEQHARLQAHAQRIEDYLRASMLQADEQAGDYEYRTYHLGTGGMHRSWWEDGALRTEYLNPYAGT